MSWRKKHRMDLLKLSFLLFVPGFVLAYLGGNSGNSLQIGLSFAFIGLGSLIALLIKN